MIEEQAIVSKIADGQIWIKSLQTGGCGGCAQQASCTTATFAKLLPKHEFVVESELVLQAGDQVVVAIDDVHLLSTSMLIYVMPILTMLLAVCAANFALPFDVAEIGLPIVALATLLLTFWLIHRFQAVFLLHFCFKPQIVRKLL